MSDTSSRVHDEVLVDADGVGLCTQAFGDTDDPAVLLIGGMSWSMDWWPEEWCLRLAAAGRYVVRHDHRDTGRSGGDPPGHPSYGGGQLGRDALAVLDGLGLRRAHLVGLSMGGGIAQELALRHPDRVASLTLLSTSPVGGVSDPLPGPAPGLMAWFDDPGPDPDWSDREAVVAWYLAGERPLAGSLGVDDDLSRHAAGRGWDRARDPAAAGNHGLVVGADEGDDGRDGGEDHGGELDVHHITAPTLVVHGSEDPLFPLEHGRALADAIPGAHLLVLDGVGHQLPPRSTWDLVLPRVIDHTRP